MTAPRIEVTVRADGSIVATTHDITGSACLDQIAILEDLLEATTVESAFTNEFTQVASAQQLQQTNAAQWQLQRRSLDDV